MIAPLGGRPSRGRDHRSRATTYLGWVTHGGGPANLEREPTKGPPAADEGALSTAYSAEIDRRDHDDLAIRGAFEEWWGAPWRGVERWVAQLAVVAAPGARPERREKATGMDPVAFVQRDGAGQCRWCPPSSSLTRVLR